MNKDVCELTRSEINLLVYSEINLVVYEALWKSLNSRGRNFLTKKMKNKLDISNDLRFANSVADVVRKESQLAK